MAPTVTEVLLKELNNLNEITVLTLGVMINSAGAPKAPNAAASPGLYANVAPPILEVVVSLYQIKEGLCPEEKLGTAPRIL